MLTVACAAATTAAAPTAPRPQWGALAPTRSATYEYVVPYGTSVRIDQGQVVDLMPRLLEVKVGESIRITNQDGRDYMIGPFFVTAGQSLAMRFTHDGRAVGRVQHEPRGRVRHQGRRR